MIESRYLEDSLENIKTNVIPQPEVLRNQGACKPFISVKSGNMQTVAIIPGIKILDVYLLPEKRISRKIMKLPRLRKKISVRCASLTHGKIGLCPPSAKQSVSQSSPLPKPIVNISNEEDDFLLCFIAFLRYIISMRALMTTDR
jgi:hypothetical protein